MSVPELAVGLLLSSKPTVRPLEPLTNFDDALPPADPAPTPSTTASPPSSSQASSSSSAIEQPVLATSLLQMPKQTGSKDRKRGKDKPAAVLLPTNPVASSVGTAPAHEQVSSEAKHEAREESNAEDAWRKIAADSWKIIRDQEKSQKDKNKDGKDDVGQSDQHRAGALASDDGDYEQPGSTSKAGTSSAKSSGGRGLFGFGRNLKRGDANEKSDASNDKKSKDQMGGLQIPDTYEGMIFFNARIVGANVQFIDLILKVWDTLVASVVNKDDFRLAKETRVIALRMYAAKMGKSDLKGYKVCMLASLRPLLPSIWDSTHEEAWEKLWDSVSEALITSQELPQKYHSKVQVLVEDLSLDEKRMIGFGVFQRLFKMNPQTEFLFKQNNERLAFIVRRAMEFSLQIFSEPRTTVEELQTLGLKHIMWGIPTEYFEPFIICCVQEMQEKCNKPDAMEGFAWALEVVASVLVLTIEDGSSPLLTAILKNSPKMVKKELGHIGRAQRPCTALGCISLDE